MDHHYLENCHHLTNLERPSPSPIPPKINACLTTITTTITLFSQSAPKPCYSHAHSMNQEKTGVISGKGLSDGTATGWGTTLQAKTLQVEVARVSCLMILRAYLFMLFSILTTRSTAVSIAASCFPLLSSLPLLFSGRMRFSKSGSNKMWRGNEMKFSHSLRRMLGDYMYVPHVGLYTSTNKLFLRRYLIDLRSLGFHKPRLHLIQWH